MFPEYRELISRLKTEDTHFSRLFERHNALDDEVRSLEAAHAPDDQVEALKREKLHLKDEMYSILRSHSDA